MINGKDYIVDFYYRTLTAVKLTISKSVNTGLTDNKLVKSS